MIQNWERAHMLDDGIGIQNYNDKAAVHVET